MTKIKKPNGRATSDEALPTIPFAAPLRAVSAGATAAQIAPAGSSLTADPNGADAPPVGARYEFSPADRERIGIAIRAITEAEAAAFRAVIAAAGQGTFGALAVTLTDQSRLVAQYQEALRQLITTLAHEAWGVDARQDTWQAFPANAPVALIRMG